MKKMVIVMLVCMVAGLGIGVLADWGFGQFQAYSAGYDDGKAAGYLEGIDYCAADMMRDWELRDEERSRLMVAGCSLGCDIFEQQVTGKPDINNFAGHSEDYFGDGYHDCTDRCKALFDFD